MKYWGDRVVRKCWVNFQRRGVLLIWIIVGQAPIALAVGADGGCLDIFSLVCLFSFSFVLSGRRSNIDGNTVSKGRYTQTNQPTKIREILTKLCPLFNSTIIAIEKHCQHNILRYCSIRKTLSTQYFKNRLS